MSENIEDLCNIVLGNYIALVNATVCIMHIYIQNPNVQLMRVRRGACLSFPCLVGRQQSVVGNRNILLRSGVKKGRLNDKKYQCSTVPVSEFICVENWRMLGMVQAEVSEW